VSNESVVRHNPETVWSIPEGFGELRRKRWASPTPPAVTTLVVAALARPELLIEIDVTAASAN
jgi:enamine deaminase RidA (YjgF/YER057c/UK114 family)